MARKQQGKETYATVADYILEAFGEDYAGLAVVSLPMAASAAGITRSGIEAAIKKGALESVVIGGAKNIYVRSLRPRLARRKVLDDGIWNALIRQARKGEPTTYTPVATPMDLDMEKSVDRTLMGKILEAVSVRSAAETEHLAGGALLLSALVCQANKGVPSPGFFKLAKKLGLKVGDPKAFLDAQFKGIYRHYGGRAAR